LVSGLRKEGLKLNRKMLADLAMNDRDAFSRLLQIAKKHLPASAARV
jgi:large subunit ribosomal protein L20